MAMSKVAPGGAEDSTIPPQAEAREAIVRFFEKRVSSAKGSYNERVVQGKRKNERSNECS
jgi:hypothetical protein